MTDRLPDDEPCYVISVAAKLVELHPQTLRYYDRIGLIKPSRTSGRIRLYSQRDIEELRRIVRLTEDLGVNLAGVEVIMHMSRRIEELQRRLGTVQEQSAAEINALRRQVQQLEQKEADRSETYQVINVSAREIKSKPEEKKP
ncbi:MAG: helix-turn-helix transcriptional regulator [Anaerolineae bacterium]|nr:helix-turn-helix transcriptional regulator [Anaerolineae bacterium]